MSYQSTLSITLKSDWKIGSGTGRPGDVDQLIRRDSDQAPFLPAKTITGVLRDGCERVTHALDEGNANGPWHTWLTYLFGNHPLPGQLVSPARAHLQLTSAQLPAELRHALEGKAFLQTALIFVKPGVKINAASGTAEDKCFRLEEMARGGITLSTVYSIDGLDKANSEQWQAAHALLAAGAALAERIGGKRRRGAGRCDIELTEMSLAQAHTYLSETKTPPLPQVPAETPGTELALSAGTDDSAWYRLPLTLTTQQPIVISKGTVGNVVESLDFIPGSHLLPIITRHLREFGVNIGDAIAQSQIIITNALPSTEENTSLPVPFALFYEKQPDGENLTAESPKASPKIESFTNKLRGEPDDGKQRKPQRSDYISLESATPKPTYDVTLYSIATGIETHNTVNDKLQRPTSEEGGVYSYQSIPAGTTLRAEVRLRADLWHELSKAQRPEDHRQWHERLEKQYSIGISRKDEYGQVQLKAAAPQLIKDNSPAMLGNELTVWLLSDLLLRDAWLRPSTEIKDFCAALALALELEADDLTLVGSDDLPEKASALLARQRRSESWQTRWGLPRPSLTGLSAGSCFRLKIADKAKLSAEALGKLEIIGLGERRVEGYGQLKLNAPLLAQQEIRVRKLQPSEKDSSSDRVVARSPVFDYARQIEKVAWQAAIQRAAATLAGNAERREKLLHLKGDSEASLTQLGGLRSQLTQLRVWQDNDPISQSLIDWLISMIAKNNKAKDTLEAAKKLLEEKETIWEWLSLGKTLQLNNGYEDLCCSVGAEDYFKRELWGEAVEVLVTECIRAHVRAVQKSNTQVEKRKALVEAN
jgi:CRISPR-associated protein Csx10